MSNFTTLPRSYSQEDIKNLEELSSIPCGSAKLISSDGSVRIDLPEPIFEILQGVVDALANGQGVSVVPHDKHLTTQEAADALNVSRPYLIKLLENGEIPHIKVGRSRRVVFKDLMQYKQARDDDRRKALDEMSAFLQDEGFYDE